MSCPVLERFQRGLFNEPDDVAAGSPDAEVRGAIEALARRGVVGCPCRAVLGLFGAAGPAATGGATRRTTWTAWSTAAGQGCLPSAPVVAKSSRLPVLACMGAAWGI